MSYDRIAIDKFGRQYFEGGLPGGGGYPSYKNAFGNRAKDAEWFMRVFPDAEMVVDLGGAYGYVAYHLERMGVRAITLDVSEWCAKNCQGDFVLASVTHLPFKDQSIDCCYSSGVLEYIPEELVDQTISEIERVFRRGLIIISYCRGGDSTHRTIKLADWWLDRFSPRFFLSPSDPWKRNVVRGRKCA